MATRTRYSCHREADAGQVEHDPRGRWNEQPGGEVEKHRHQDLGDDPDNGGPAAHGTDGRPMSSAEALSGPEPLAPLSAANA